MHFDLLGRIALPECTLDRLGICEDNRALLVRVSEKPACIILQAADRETRERLKIKDFRDYRIVTRQQTSPEDWEELRHVDDEQREMVLPLRMRVLLDWNEQTELFMICCDDLVYIVEDRESEDQQGEAR